MAMRRGGSTSRAIDKSKLLSLTRIIIFLLVLLPELLVAQANQETKIFKDGGFYVGVSIGASGLSGKYLNGQYLLTEENELYFLPRVERGLALTFLFGQRKRPGSWEIGFTTSRPPGSILDLDATIGTSNFFIRGKRYVFLDSRIQPCLIVGANYYRLGVQDASISMDFPYEIGKAIFSGFGVEAGLGLACYLNQVLTMNVNLLYSYEAFLWSKGALRQTHLMTSSNAFFGGVYNASVGITCTF